MLKAWSDVASREFGAWCIGEILEDGEKARRIWLTFRIGVKVSLN